MAKSFNEIKTYKDLLVWQKAVQLVKDIYRHTSNFPAEEKFGLCSQIRRCAVSIPSNIAEGYGRHSTHDYIRFLNVAMGSLYELETQLIIAYELEFITAENHSLLEKEINEVERMLSSLKSKVEGSI